MKKKVTRLAKFIKDECSNYDKHYQKCLSFGTCLVFANKRCDYFEHNVLNIDPDYKFRTPGYDYSKLFAQYTKQTNAKTTKVKTRKCQCGSPLGYRQRMCEKCRLLRRVKVIEIPKG